MKPATPLVLLVHLIALHSLALLAGCNSEPVEVTVAPPQGGGRPYSSGHGPEPTPGGGAGEGEDTIPMIPQPGGGSAPVIRSVTAYPQSFHLAQPSMIVVEAEDPDGESLQYSYEILSGAGTVEPMFGGAAQVRLNRRGSHSVRVRVRDGSGLSAESTIQLHGENNDPVIESFVLDAASLPRHESAGVLISAHGGDDEYEALSYAYEVLSGQGSIAGAGEAASFVAGAGTGTAIVRVTVRDPYDGVATATTQVSITPWESVGGGVASSGHAQDVSLELSGSDVYVAYRDFAADGKATAMKLTGGSWSVLGSPGVSGMASLGLQVKINGSTPQIFYNAGSGGTLGALSFSGSIWSHLGNDDFTSPSNSASGETNPKLSVAYLGSVPYVSFRNFDNYLRTYAYSSVSNSWSLQGPLTFTNLSFSRFGLDSRGGELRMAYQELSGGKVSVRRLVGAGPSASWQAVGPTSFSAGGGREIALTHAPNGTPYVAFADSSLGLKATVMRLNGAGNAWEVVGAAGFSPGPVTSIAFKLDSQGRPVVAFRDESMEYRATVMRLNGAGTAWEILGSRGFSRGVADYIDLELAGTVPHVAFRDLGREARAVVLRLVE